MFNGLSSFDVDAGDGISNYVWNYGDGSAVDIGPTPTHTYQTTGTRTLSLTVTDRHNATATTTTTVAVAAAPTTVPPAGTTQGNAAQFIRQSVPTTITPGQSYPASVTMRNTGTTTWSAAHLYRLGSQNPQDNSTWGRTRIYLQTAVVPGAEVTFSFTFVAPCSGCLASPLHFRWRMVQDAVEWFGDLTPDQTVYIANNNQTPNLSAPQPGPRHDLFTARIATQNRIGKPGEDLLSRNFNWGTSLLNLTGRAGLNLDLGLSYNSLSVWTKTVTPTTSTYNYQEITAFTFDADRGFPSPGFRLGFPTIEGPYSNVQTQKSSYLMLTPSGARVELRQLDNSNVYEAVDSSNLQLLYGDNGSLLVRGSDGTQLAFWSINSAYRCTEIKDSNGNFISIKYDPINGTANLGRVTSVIDTLGRVISFNYDTKYRLQTITQVRNGQSHVWASFGYTNKAIETNFSAGESGNSGGDGEMESDGGPVIGLPSPNTVSVLTQVGLDDGSRYNFDYSSWGQIYQIHHYAADGSELNYTKYDLPHDNSVEQTDCPRFTERRDWVKNWNGGAEAITQYAYTPQQPNSYTNWTLDNLLEASTWSQAVLADGTVYREYSNSHFEDWGRGLITKTEIYSSNNTSVPKKTTVTDWTQDMINVPYPVNPRPITTTVSDAEGNRKRTTIEYNSFNLPSDVYEWGPFGSNDWRTLRRTHTDYNLSDVYVNRRIIGLVAGQYLFAPDAPNSNSIQTLLSKTTMEYDNAVCSGYCYWSTVTYEYGPENQAPEGPGGGNPVVVQHDGAYSGAFQVGRGLLAKVQRWDAFDETNVSKMTTSSLVYNLHGSLIRTVDALSHATQIHYNDSFSNTGVGDNSVPFLTMAYVTSVRGDSSSTAKYNYDLGLVTRAMDAKGAVKTTEYDSAGRVKRVTNAVNGAYTRFVYPTGQIIVNQFTTIQEGQGEAYSATIFDGAGRVRATASDFPNSTAPYSGQFTLYDVMGRAIKQTNPTEMSNTWAAAGDDGVGWYSSSQSYDWKGRPLVTTNTDGTTKEASYGGCGCAGGGVVTLTDEGTSVGTAVKKRQQKIYSDVLGRTVRTEILNWDGAGAFGTGGTVYSTTASTYNARDQVTLVRQFQGVAPSDPNVQSCPSGTCQQTTITYDGLGRLKTKHLPEQGAGTATTYNYNSDDTVSSVIDARGASQAFSYNERHLVTGITYSAPTGITATTPVNYAYDAAGNRTSMTDGSGSLVYSYDQLSRMTSETRTFTGLPGSSYTLSYGYNLAGQLTSLSEPGQFGSSVSYAYDQAGRLTNVTGAGFAGGVSQFASNMKYRATNAVKEMDYGNGFRLNNSFNSRLQITNYQVKLPNTPVGQGERARSDYEYNADGQIKAAYDRTDQQFNRGYAYDHASRLVNATTASAAYYQSFIYDAFDNMTQRGNGSWRYYDTTVSQYQNNRNVYTLTSPMSYPSCCPPQPSYWTYDSDGNVTHDQNKEYTFDAAGKNTRVFETSAVGVSLTKKLWIYQDYDSDGQRVKRVEQTQYNTGPYSFVTSYYLRSSVLDDSVITELTESGQKRQTFVYAEGVILAKQKANQVTWMHIDPVTNSARETNSAANLAARVEFDPLGNDAPLTDPQPPEMTPDYEYLGNYGNNGNPYDGASGCTIDGQPVSCSFAAGFINIGAAAVCPNNNCGPRFNGSEWEFLHFTDEGMGYGQLNPYQPALRRVTPQERKRRKQAAKKKRENPDGVGKDEKSPQISSYFFGGQRGRPIEHRADQADVYVADCRVIAMLDAIAWAEGTTGDADDGYGRIVRGTVLRAPNNPELVGQSNVTITDFTRHPNILVQVQPGLNSTAAGRYQFLHRTWSGFNLPDFSAAHQDLGATILLVQAGSINPLLRGDVRQAAANANGTWASLPNSPYGQPTRAMEDFQAAYDEALTACQNRPRFVW